MQIETLSVKLIGDVTDFSAKMLSAGRAIDMVGDKMSAVGDRMQAIGAKWSLYVSAPLIAMGKAAIDSAADYEVSMNVIEQVTDATAAQMAAMSAQALKLGKDTVFSAGEAATAQLELAKAGMNVEQVMAAMPGVLDLAAAGNVELGTAAKLTARVLNAFNLKASESARVANLLAGAANNSAADISDLSLGMAQGGFAFASAGWKVEDLAASLAILTNVGLKGTDAGTALKNMTMQLISPTEKATKIMRVLGINVFDAQGKMKNLGEVVGIFQDKMAFLTDQERLWALENILGSDGMKAMIPLLSQGAAGLATMTANVTEQGQAADVANARMKGLRGAIEYLKGTIDTLMIQTATPWLDEIGRIIRATADWIAKFGDLDPALQRTIVKFLAIGAALGPVLMFAGMLVSVVGGLVSVFSLLFSPVVVVGVALAKLLLPIDKVNRAFGSIKTVALRALELLRAGVMSALTAIEKLFGINLDAVRRGVEVAYAAIGQVIRVGFFKVITDMLKTHWESWKRKFWDIAKVVEAWAKEWGRLAWRWIVDIAIPMSLEKLKSWGNVLLNWAKGSAPAWGAQFRAWGAAAWGWIVEVAIPQTGRKLAEWWGQLRAWATANYPTWRAALLRWGEAAWRWIVDVAIPRTSAKLTALWGTFSAWATANYPRWRAQWQQWAAPAWQWITEVAIPATRAKLTVWGNVLRAKATELLLGWREALVGWGVATWQWIVESTPAAIQQLISWAGQLYAYVKGELPNWLAQFTEWKVGLFQWIVDALPTVLKEFGDLVGIFYNGTKEGITALLPLWAEMARITWAWIRDTAYPAVVTELAALWELFSGWVVNNYHVWRDKLLEWGTAAWVWLRDVALPNTAEKLGEWWGLLSAWVVNNYPVWRDKLLEWGAAAWAWIRDVAIPYTQAKLGELWAWIKGWVSDNYSYWRDKLLEWGDAAWRWIQDVALPKVKEKLGELGAWIKGWIADNHPDFAAWLADVTEFTTDALKAFQDHLPQMGQAIVDLGQTAATELPIIGEHFRDLWEAIFGDDAGGGFGNFMGWLVTTTIKAVGTIMTQIRALMDAFDILVQGTGAIMSGDWDKYWQLKDQWNRAWSDFGSATANQWEQFRSLTAGQFGATGTGFAEGGRVGSSGRYLVGEHGAEMVTLPAGAHVTSSRDMGGVGGVTIYQTFTGNPDRIAVEQGTRSGVLLALRQVGQA